MQTIAAFFLIALPWLNPFAPGPSAGVVPLLFSWACAGALLLVFLGGSDRAAGARLVRATAAAWLAAALLSSLMGVLQYFGATALFGIWINHTGLGEAYANLRQRNQFATLTNIGLAALLWWVAQGRSASLALPATATSKALDGRLLGAWLAAMVLGVGNAASSSRTGLLQLVMLIVLALIWRGAERQRTGVGRVLALAVLAYAVAALALPLLSGQAGIVARLQEGDTPCSSRLTLWRNVLYLIAQKPLWGWGWGELDYAHFITLYPGARFCEILDNAHNLPLHLAVELGVPLALLVCGGGLWLTWRARVWHEQDVTRQMAWAVLAVILLHSLLEYPLWYGPFQMAFVLSVWLLWRSPASSHRTGACATQGAVRRSVLILGALAAMSLITFCGYAAWDYERISQIYKSPAERAEAFRENTLAKIADTRLFANQVRFADLTLADLTQANAAQRYAQAQAVLHFSPEPRVIEKLIESATLLGLDQEALYYGVRYQAAFPVNHAAWVKQKSL